MSSAVSDSFTRLPDELLEHIFLLLTNSEPDLPHSISSCLLVNHRFYRISFPLTIQQISLEIASEDDQWTVQNKSTQTLLRHGSRVLSFFHTLCIRSVNEKAPDWGLIQQLIPRMPALQNLVIMSRPDIPAILFRHLEQHCPKAEIHLCFHHLPPRLQDAATTTQVPEDLSSFQRVPITQLRTISFRWTNNALEQARIRSMISSMIRCNSGPLHIGAIFEKGSLGKAYPLEYALDRNDVFDFAMQPTDPPADIHAIDWIHFSPRTMNALTNKGIWQNLHTLKLYYQESSGWWTGAPITLPSLHTLVLVTHFDIDKMTGGNSGDVADIVAPVKHLAIIGHGDVELPTRYIARFRETLERLNVDPDPVLHTHRGVCSTDSLERLNRAAPHLRELTLSTWVNWSPEFWTEMGEPNGRVERVEPWYEHIAQFPNLSRLNINLAEHFDAGEHEQDWGDMRGLFEFVEEKRKGVLETAMPFERLQVGRTCGETYTDFLDFHWVERSGDGELRQRDYVHLKGTTPAVGDVRVSFERPQKREAGGWPECTLFDHLYPGGNTNIGIDWSGVK